MTASLQAAIEKAKNLSEEQQNVLAALLLEEMNAEKRWDEVFSGSLDQLKSLADEALDENRAGTTEILDPDQS